MATLKILAGDFPKCSTSIGIYYDKCIISLPWQPGDGWSVGSRYTFTKDTVEECVLASEENVKRLSGTVGWGVAGAALLGPVGLLAGLFLGGKKQESTFIIKFTDDKKLLGTTDSKTYAKLQTYLM